MTAIRAFWLTTMALASMACCAGPSLPVRQPEPIWEDVSLDQRSAGWELCAPLHSVVIAGVEVPDVRISMSSVGNDWTVAGTELAAAALAVPDRLPRTITGPIVDAWIDRPTGAVFLIVSLYEGGGTTVWLDPSRRSVTALTDDAVLSRLDQSVGRSRARWLRAAAVQRVLPDEVAASVLRQSDERPALRLLAALHLWIKRGDRHPESLPLLDDVDDPDERLWCADWILKAAEPRLMGRVPRAAADWALHEVLGRRDRVAAADALSYLRGVPRSHVEDLLALAEWRDPLVHVRRGAVASIPDDAVPMHLSRVSRLAEDPEPEVAAAARARLEARR